MQIIDTVGPMQVGLVGGIVAVVEEQQLAVTGNKRLHRVIVIIRDDDILRRTERVIAGRIGERPAARRERRRSGDERGATGERHHALCNTLRTSP